MKKTFTLVLALAATSFSIHAQSVLSDMSFAEMPSSSTIIYSTDENAMVEISGENAVTVGGQFGPYQASVVYRVRTYQEDGVMKMDVEIPSYSLGKTIMGDVTLGAYTVKGLAMDESKGGFYKDYAQDNLTIHMTAKTHGMVTMDGDYQLSVAGHENILVEMTDGKVKITNHFQPGSMPFPITAVMTQNVTSGIEDSVADADKNASHRTYNLLGRRTGSHSQGIVIRNGKKLLVK